MYYLVGLGNPGEEYENTRHNAGRMFVEAFCKTNKFKDFKEDLPAGKAGKKTQSLKTGDKNITCILPETFMNKSGSALKKIITSKKKTEDLIIAHDDIDLPLGKYRISFGRGSGGHKGVESVMRAVKTKNFYRLRIGVSPATPKGKIKKPKSEKVVDFLMGKFKTTEMSILKKTAEKIILDFKFLQKG